LTRSHDIHELEKISIPHGIFCQDYGPGQPREFPFVGVGIGNVETGGGGGDDFVACLWDGPFYLGLVVRVERRRHPSMEGAQGEQPPATAEQAVNTEQTGVLRVRLSMTVCAQGPCSVME